MEIKDYKQFLADGGEIMHKDGTKVTEAHKWADGSYAFLYSDGTGVSRVFERDIVEYHTFRAPEIPSSSLAELEEWRKANGISVENENSDDMCFHECPNCNDRCYCSAQPCSCCTQDEPDYKGLYEQRTAQFNELLAKYENQTPSRNWVAECAMAFVSTKGLGFEDSWDKAQQWAAEGKKRGHIN